MVVDAGGDAGVADVGVNGVGEINDGGAFGKVNDVAFWGEDKNAIGKNVDFHRFK